MMYLTNRMFVLGMYDPMPVDPEAMSFMTVVPTPPCADESECHDVWEQPGEDIVDSFAVRPGPMSEPMNERYV